MGANIVIWLALGLGTAAAHPPAAHPPSARPTCTPSAAAARPPKFTIYFGWDEAGLTAEARQQLDNLILFLPEPERAQLRVVGHTDRERSPEYAVGLSQRMAEGVRDYLISRGVGEPGIRTEAMGSSRPAIVTAQGVREPRNRRVEIFLSGFDCS